MTQMKDSGVDWIGKIPAPWKVEKLKFNAKSRHEKYDESIFDFIALENIESFTASYVNTENVYDITKFSVARIGDVLFGKLRPYLTKTYLCDRDVCVGPGIEIFKPTNFENRFLKYLFLNPAFIDYINSYSHGTKMPAILAYSLENSLMIVPPHDEQIKISNFLDSKNSEIKSLIDNLNKQIESLKDYKKEIISEAVTKGLDPNVSLKDSGVEWIGKIPTPWNVVRIKDVSWLRGRIGWQGLNSSDYIESGPFLITGTDFLNGYINWNSCVHITDERYEEDQDIHIKEDDLLITKDGTIGKVAIARKCPSKVSLNSGILLIRNTKKYKYLDRYLYYVLLSNVFSRWYELSQTGNSTIRHLYQGQFYYFKFPYPSLNEQNQISKYLDAKCNQIDQLIIVKQQTIDKLNEYLKSLIYEYVTGKKEVI